MSKTRAGRKSHETRVNFNNNVANFAASFANAKWKYDASQTGTMIIERINKQTGETARMTFSQAYGELSAWYGKAFNNTSKFGLSDFLAETFLQGAEIHTLKAIYRLWTEPQLEPEAAEMICLSSRKKEFIEAMARGENSNLEVFNDFERDSFVVVNHDNKKEYRVNLCAEGGRVFADCECADFSFRRRICKHIGSVLADTVFGVLSRN